MLPHTRKEVFWDVVRLHWGTLLLCGTVLLLSALPLILTSVAESIRIYSITQSDSMTPAEAADGLYAIENLYALLRFFFLLPMAVAVAGLARVIRQYAWEENVFFPFDFPKGIRQNIRQSLVIFLLAGSVCTVCTLLYNVLSYTADQSMDTFYWLLLVFLLLVILPISAYGLVCMSIYSEKTGKILKIAWIVTLKAPVKTALALLCCLSPCLLQWIPSFYFWGQLLACIAAPFMLLSWYLFALNRLDEHIHCAHYPDLVGRGLYTEPSEARSDPD